MSLKFLPDYYPVFLDLREMAILNGNEKDLENSAAADLNPDQKMLNAETLTEIALESGFSTFQTFLLLVKNAFEGDVYLNHQIKPDQLIKTGTILLYSKPELLIPNFYEHILEYKGGLLHIWSILLQKEPHLEEVDLDLVIHGILINHIIRFPVSMFASYDFSSLLFQTEPTANEKKQRFSFGLLGEQLLGQFRLIELVNMYYADKFKAFSQEYKLKEDMFTYYQKRLVLALSSGITSELELDEQMYKNLVEEKLRLTHLHKVVEAPPGSHKAEKSYSQVRIKNRTKALYRLISKNCMEIHVSKENENGFPGLNQVFLHANVIYNEPVTTVHQTFLQYLRLLLLLSQVIVHRKLNNLPVGEHLQLISDFSGKEVLVFKDDLGSLSKNAEEQLMEYRAKNQTEYKMKFIVDEEFTEIHKHYLQKQLDFIDEQIEQIQKDIRKILQIKSEGFSQNSTKEEEE